MRNHKIIVSFCIIRTIDNDELCLNTFSCTALNSLQQIEKCIQILNDTYLEHNRQNIILCCENKKTTNNIDETYCGYGNNTAERLSDKAMKFIFQTRVIV